MVRLFRWCIKATVKIQYTMIKPILTIFLIAASVAVMGQSKTPIDSVEKWLLNNPYLKHTYQQQPSYKKVTLLQESTTSRYVNMPVTYQFQSTFRVDSLGNLFVFDPIKNRFYKLKTETIK